MKKHILNSLSLISLFLTFSWSAYAQLYDPCALVPLDELAQCIAENGGGGGGWTPPVPDQPPVIYALGTTGDVYISTSESVYEGIPTKIRLVKNGSAQAEVIYSFPLGTRISGLTLFGDTIAEFFWIVDQWT